MSTRQEQEVQRNVMEEDAVISFLQHHPNFFEQHTTLLENLQLPHHTGGAVSLVERQVSALRESNRQLKKKLHDLVDIARENNKLSENMHDLTLALLSANAFIEVIKAVSQHLQRQFPSDVVTIALMADAIECPTTVLTAEQNLLLTQSTDPRLEVFGTIIEKGSPVCGRLKTGQLSFLFEKAATEIKSAALIPLIADANTTASCLYGLIAIGSHDPRRFHVSKGTVFLTQLGQIASRAIQRHSH